MALIDLNNSLVASYNLDGNSVDNKSALNGTDTAITYSAGNGKILQGAGFNGSTSKIDIANNSNFNFGNGTNDLPFTVEGWFYFNSTTGPMFLVNKRGGTGATDEWSVAMVSGQLYFGIFSNIPNDYLLINTTASLSINTWYHVACVYNGNGLVTGMDIYVNNALQSVTRNTTGTYTKMPTSTTPVVIGRAGWAVGFFFNGRVDIIRMYKNYKADASDVSFLYNSGKGIQYPFFNSKFFNLL